MSAWDEKVASARVKNSGSGELTAFEGEFLTFPQHPVAELIGKARQTFLSGVHFGASYED